MNTNNFLAEIYISFFENFMFCKNLSLQSALRIVGSRKYHKASHASH